MKYTEEYLKELADDGLVYPKHREVYNQMLYSTLRSMMGDAADAPENEDYVLDIEPFEYVSDLSLMVNELAELILEERAETRRLLQEIKRSIEDSIDDIDRTINQSDYGSNNE